jgi:hypothetical protein
MNSGPGVENLQRFSDVKDGARIWIRGWRVRSCAGARRYCSYFLFYRGCQAAGCGKGRHDCDVCVTYEIPVGCASCAEYIKGTVQRVDGGGCDDERERECDADIGTAGVKRFAGPGRIDL